MAFGGSFKEDHPYATGILLIVVAGFGVAGSVTGQLAAMLAALWVPTALEANQSYGQSSSGGGLNIGGILKQGLTGGLVDTSTGSSTTPTSQGGPPPNQASIGSTSGIAGTTT